MTYHRIRLSDFRRLSTGAVAVTVHDNLLHKRQNVILQCDDTLAWESPYLPKREAAKVARLARAFRSSNLQSFATPPGA